MHMYNLCMLTSYEFLNPEFICIFIIFAGFILGLGGTTVIDILGFLGRNSLYWTDAAIKCHKVTKPLVWTGIFLIVIGVLYEWLTFQKNFLILERLLIITGLILNGSFLSFYISPLLLKREANKEANQILPNSLKLKITVSFLLSATMWWSLFAITVYRILQI